MGTIETEKLTLKNMGIAFGMLSQSGTEPEIIYPPVAMYVFKNTIATLGLIHLLQCKFNIFVINA